MRVLDADLNLRTQARISPAAQLGISGNKPQPVLLAIAYICPKLDDGAKLELWDPAGPNQSPGTNVSFDHLFIFWSSCFFQHVSEGEQGSSWIELSAFFQALGGLLYPSEQHDQPHRSFKTQLIFSLVAPGPFLLPKALLPHRSCSNLTARQGADYRSMDSAFVFSLSMFFSACILKLPRLCTRSCLLLKRLVK